MLHKSFFNLSKSQLVNNYFPALVKSGCLFNFSYCYNAKRTQ